MFTCERPVKLGGLGELVLLTAVASTRQTRRVGIPLVFAAGFVDDDRHGLSSSAGVAGSRLCDGRSPAGPVLSGAGRRNLRNKATHPV